MKPKIIKAGKKWRCSIEKTAGQAFCGYGSTPEESYYSWKRMINSVDIHPNWFMPEKPFYCVRTF
jgi:hypothetical protein